jgi:hypothetical protein
MNKKRLYKIIFHNQDSIYELYARSIAQGPLYGFVEIAELVFGETSKLLVDPAEERLKSEFAGVERIHIPVHSVIRIDEVDKTGTAKITDTSGENKVTPFPHAQFNPRSDTPK